MSDALGRGLESLIPSRPSEDGSSSDPVAGSEEAEANASPTESSPQVHTASASAQPASARTYQDHFTPKRGESIFWIEIEKIEPNPFQPRREFNEAALQDLSRSIREHGVLQPIIVSKREKETPQGLEVRYELIAGERRWRAAQIAGVSQLPAIIRRGMPDDRIKLELALIENVQREDLNGIERARAFKQLIDEFHLIQREVAARVGKSREFVANSIRLLSLPEGIQQALHRGDVTEGHARAVLMVGDDSIKQMQVFEEIVASRLNVREAESHARQVAGRALVPRSRAVKIQDPEMRQWQDRLEEKLGTKVKLQRIGDRGKIVMEFYSDEEMRSLIKKLTEQLGERMELPQGEPMREV